MKKKLNVKKFNIKKLNGGRLNEVKQPKTNNSNKSNIKFFFQFISMIFQ